MKLNSIQYLRAIAALLVVYCHAIDVQMQHGVSFQQNFYFLQNFGAIGVDLFFVISGFIIVYVSDSFVGKRPFVDFLKKRFVRINPSYYLVSSFMILLCLRKFPIDSLIKTITILPVVEQGKEFVYPLLAVGWTLSFEWFFYLVYASFILFKSSYKNTHTLLLLLLLTVIGLIFPYKEVHYTFFTNPLVLEFCFGVVIAMIYKKNLVVNKAIALIFIITGFAIYMQNIFWGYGNISEAKEVLFGGALSWERVARWGIPSALIVFGSVFLEKQMVQENKKSTKISMFFLLVGDASYAIYLVHFVFIKYLSRVLVKIGYKGELLNADIFIIVVCAVSIALGIIYYKKIERPLTKYAQQLLEKKS